MDLFRDEPIAIDLVYADAGHPENIFGIAAYHSSARLVLHKDLARVVLKTARLLRERHHWTLVLKDGLRPVEAQQALIDTDIVRHNSHWLQEPRLLSGPGQGAHPRGMAIDVAVQGADDTPIDMGTVFDAMVPESARGYTGFSPAILGNRHALETAFLAAAESLSLPLLLLPSEWWDFRFPPAYFSAFAPLSDRDLPEGLTMCSPSSAAEEADLERLANAVLLSL